MLPSVTNKREQTNPLQLIKQFCERTANAERGAQVFQVTHIQGVMDATYALPLQPGETRTVEAQSAVSFIVRLVNTVEYISKGPWTELEYRLSLDSEGMLHVDTQSVRVSTHFGSV